MLFTSILCKCENRKHYREKPIYILRNYGMIREEYSVLYLCAKKGGYYL